ncbi:endonuclease/exonuclease/phosphatase family protein [Alkalibacterium gilvum]|uniref:endonuclease/exonuclease/phosphatase family protein n=1 Tax=Alkalibacterium gilvum TaxID=1130080 RepID=UPI003F8ED784
MKVLTLNTHAWMEEESYDKIEKIIDRILAKDYTFIALQEINQSIEAEEVEDPGFIQPEGDDPGIRIKADNFALLIVKGLRERGLNYYWSWTANHIGYDKYDEGVALLSQTPYTAESLRVSNSDDYTHHYTRRVLKAATRVNGNRWNILSCHYSWWKDGKGRELFKSEWDRTRTLLEDDDKTSHLIMGDFNNEATLAGEGYNYINMTTPFLSDTYTEAEKKVGEATVISAIDGWEGHAYEKRIDYIFTDNRKHIDTYRVVFDNENGPIVSDHFGVEVELTEK